MTLDFTTLYVVILANSLLMAIVWIVVYRAYERLDAAGIWGLACIVLIVTGAVLASNALVQSPTPLFAGNLLATFALCLFWVGIRRFESRPAPWATTLVLVVVTAVMLFPFSYLTPNEGACNTIYAVAQSIPLVFAVGELLHRNGRSPGRMIALGAMSVAVLARAVEASANIGVMLDLVRPEFYAVVEPALILFIVFSAVLWNFGLMLMVIDRLYARLNHQARHDELTGLANRRAFDERLRAEIAAATQSGRPLAMLVIDLDGLKILNDVHGHLAGDAGIVHVARRVAARLRPGDLMARTGGDKFCILLPAATAEQAGAMAATLVAAVREAPLRLSIGRVPLTLSAGAAAWHKGQDADALTAAADAALYRAKTAGRDGWAVADFPDLREIAFRTAPAELRAM